MRYHQHCYRQPDLRRAQSHAGASWKSTAAAKTSKSPKLVKRGRPAFSFFLRVSYKQIRAENEALSHKEAMQLVGEKWQSLSDRAKEEFKEMAVQDKMR